MSAPLSEELARTYRTRELIEELLADPRQLGPDYEPIHRVSDGELVGYKATGRGAAGTALADTLSLLDGARPLGLVERIDWAFRALAMTDMLARPDLALHLTPEPETYGMPCPPRFAGVMGRARRELTIAAEFHAEAFDAGVALARGIAEVREWGWQVVLTDVADEPHALRRAAELAPDVVQVDLRRAGRAAGGDHQGVRAVLETAAAHGAQIMAINVDTPALRERAAQLGATLARGGYYGNPGALPAS